MTTQAGKSPKTIVVVDDEPFNFELLESILTPEGFQVRYAENGTTALKMIPDTKPDIILLDIMMPDMNGYDVCAKIRADETLPYIPIIFITAMYTTTADVIHGFDIGGDDYILKPFDPPELLSRLRAALRLKESIDRLTRVQKELSRYVSLSTLQMVNGFASDGRAVLGETRDVTVLFSDIRDFTRISEDHDPHEVFDILNRYISRQIDIIEKHAGIIDKLSGDEIMAVFEGPQMVVNALSCGYAIVKSLRKTEGRIGDDWIGIGIGINAGPVYVGSIGSETYKDFTVVGNTVNIAARLCGHADKFQVLFTEHILTHSGPPQIAYRSIGKILLKGFSKEIELFELII